MDKSKNLPEGKLKNQCRTCEAALKHCFVEVFGRRKVLDKVVSAFFRANKKFGSRDRQFINESIFAVFRYWGIVQKLLDTQELAAIKEGRENYSALSLGKIIYFALLLDGSEFAAMRFWRSELKNISVEYNSDPIEMANRVFAELKMDEKATLSDVIPLDFQGLISKDIDLSILAERLASRPPMWIRLQTDKVEELFEEFNSLGFDYQFHPKITTAVSLNNPKVNLYTLESFKKGYFELQDLASQVIGLVANPHKGERWLDVCAGAGGKTLQLATLMERKGTVVASDIRSYKLQDLKLRAKRAAFPNIMTKEFDNSLFKGKNAGKYDGVLVDAPCSCSGVWRRNAESRWTLDISELEEISRIQLEILEKSCTAVKIEGFLIYATCSIFLVENEAVVREFLKRHEEFKLVEFVNPLNGEIVPDGMLQADIKNNNCDSMFVAKLMRK
ncbi:MAG: RsmB/NOP family class I SAM-dependent RNA methyltransferase [Lentisphaeria bacterium]|nr:RsmB/NOP family class I SAM-dependent RNA methyltransferase [Lentisphaeria bacterium]